jgi:hypothetical protein
MPSRAPLGMPLTREELIKLKHQLDPDDYLVVESGRDRILVIRSAREFPDIVNDLDGLINKLDIRDTNDLSSALIIGEEEVVGVPLEAINSLITRRNEEDEQIATDLGEKLIEPYTTLLFESENDPLKTLRLGIRVRGNLKDFKAQEIPELLFSKIKSLPRHSEVVYLITEDGYIRLSGIEFYRKLHEFLKENPNKNRELAKEFIYMTRGKLADHFIDNGSLEDIFETSKQENINKFITKEQPTRQDQPVTPELKPEVREKVKPPVGSETPAQEISEVKPEVELEPEPEIIIEREIEEMPPRWSSDMEQKLKVKAETDKQSLMRTALESKPGLGPEPRSTKPQLTNAELLILLQEKLSKVGMEVIHGVDIPGVELAVNNQDSFIKRVFFSYMPEFDLKKAVLLERSIERFSPDLSIIIGASGVDNPDTKLFAVGKNMLVIDVDTILYTDFLIHLEERI